MNDKLDMQTPNWANINTEKLAKLFPNCVTETTDGLKLDFDLLKQELTTDIVDGTKERYRLEWPGKREAIVTANLPTTKTLRPILEDSVDFDNTENIYIEGDNLEVLKLLQESYLGKIKMIYIDPPYNTGKDFVYKDNYSRDSKEEFEESGQKDEYNQRLISNPETSGRYHSNWLTMMFPRLKLGRNLLTEDGVIFISIDDNEVHNLKKLCDEIFGEMNFEGHIHWRRRHNQPNDKSKLIGLVAEHILVYAKSSDKLKLSGVGKLPLTGTFTNPDNDVRGDWASKPWKVGSDQNGSKYKITTPTGKILDEEWMGDETNYKNLLADKRIVFPNNGDGSPRKKYFKFEREEEGQCATNWWSHELFGHNQEGNSEMTELFDGRKNLFSNPKNTRLLNSIIQLANVKDGDTVLDFFSGSASTAHAIFNVNAENKSKVSFILVQIPENLEESKKGVDSKTKKQLEDCIEFLDSINKPSYLSELGKERIRRSGKKIKEEKLEHAKKEGIFADFSDDQDYGFRVYKLDESNMQDVYYKPQDYSQTTLDIFADNVKDGRSSEDLLAQVMLDWGLPLSLKIEHKKITEKEVFAVAGDSLYACFDKGIDETFAKELAKDKPLRIVFRDKGFKDDTAKENVKQLLKQLSPETEMKVL
ncbi:site-specific DNA-methyltransferase [Pedobacter gandavensis]|uniref:site-specific DNA-methyltransferase (adenine-specific) n=1 Tax=Pedobacter gandavensis TaxID=2679963 RepID=A0ABR6EZ52_9SPHI|nr:site-specific DNA-methyltransferase [Pedobacter gandavensis]MBB2150560.1 site-specific DNA-methyltransferase [Pedobacter gandavensis]